MPSNVFLSFLLLVPPLTFVRKFLFFNQSTNKITNFSGFYRSWQGTKPERREARTLSRTRLSPGFVDEREPIPQVQLPSNALNERVRYLVAHLWTGMFQFCQKYCTLSLFLQWERRHDTRCFWNVKCIQFPFCSLRRKCQCHSSLSFLVKHWPPIPVENTVSKL